MYAYAEEYLNDSMENLGEAFDYAVNACGLTLDAFWELFLTGGYADSFACAYFSLGIACGREVLGACPPVLIPKSSASFRAAS